MNLPSQRAWFTEIDLKQRLSPFKLQLLVLGVAFVSYLSDFSASVFPCHDAREYLSAFQVFYSGLYHDNALTLWLPYGRYGTVSALMYMYITPVGFCVGGIGKLLGVTDVLMLFKCVLLVEYLVFCLGTVKLALLLFERYESVLLVSLGAIFCVNLTFSLDANFHTYYMLPFILRSLTLFLSTGRVRQLWQAGVLCVFACIGNVPYHPPFLALLLTLYALTMLAQGSLKGKRLAFSLSDALPLLVLIAGAAVFVGFYVTNLEGLAGLSTGRDPVTGRVTTEAFLTYGGVTKIPNLIKEYLLGVHTHGDNTFYLGLAPLALAAYALFRCRRRECLAFAVLAAFVVAFSFGGIVARIAYYFPGMSLYRHISLVFGQARVFLLFVAGFGLDTILQKAAAGEPLRASGKGFEIISLSTAAGRIRFGILFVMLAEAVFSFFNATPPWDYALYPFVEAGAWPLNMLLLRLLVYGACGAIAAGLIHSKSLAGPVRVFFFVHVLLLAFAYDMGSYRAAGIFNWPNIGGEDLTTCRELFSPRKLAYVKTRKHPAQWWKQSKELQFIAAPGMPQCMYVHVWEVLGLDPCHPYYRTDFVSEYVAELFRRRNLTLAMFPGDNLFDGRDRWITNAVGYGAPKLRLIAQSDLNAEFLEPDPPRKTVAPMAPLGEVQNVELGPDRMTATVQVSTDVPVRLYYADAFHPGWRAFVNGVETPITRTNIAFKSVPLKPGTNTVEFRFWNGWGARFLYMLAIGAVLIALYVAICLLREPEIQLDKEI